MKNLSQYKENETKIKFVCDTDADGEIIDRKLWNINYKED